MKTFVFELIKDCTMRYRSLLIVDAESKEKAKKAVSKAINSETIYWDEDEELENDISYEVQSDSCNDDYTFDFSQYSTQGMQPLNSDGTMRFTDEEINEICKATGHRTPITLKMYEIICLTEDEFKSETPKPGYNYLCLASGKIVRIPSEQYCLKNR